MTATTVSLQAKGIGIGGNADGIKLWVIDSAAKAAQNDILEITNANTVITALLVTDAAGAAETHTISDNKITLTSATTGTVSGVIVYK